MISLQEIYEAGPSKQELERLLQISPFLFFGPKLPYLSSGSVKRAVSGEKDVFTRQMRSSFFPDLSDSEVCEGYCGAMNRGVLSLNKLCEEHLGEEGKMFLSSEVVLHFFFLIFWSSERTVQERSGLRLEQENTK